MCGVKRNIREEVTVSVLCSHHNLDQLESLNDDLEAHCYALNLLLNQEGFGPWPDARFKLLYERVSFLTQTCFDLRVFASALRQGRDFNAVL